MGNNETRLISTGIIWTAFTVIMIGAMVTGAFADSGIFFLMGFGMLLAGVVIATGFVWKYGNNSVSSVEQSEKAKRRSRVERMLDNMDRNDLDELRSRLMSESDGEAVGLEELLTERERQRR